jgi:plasmid stabilization system protein ParE
MSIRKTDDFLSEVERQFEWYVLHANWEIADHYLDAVEATTKLLERHQQLGPQGGFTHPRLLDWRFFVVFRPFHKHILFYEIADNDVIMRRAMHGHRDLPRRLLEPS